MSRFNTTTVHRLRRAGTPVLALLLAACDAEPIGEPELLLPDLVSVAWEDEYNQQNDGLGALVPVDVMVYDGASGEPLRDVEVQVWTDDVAAWPTSAEGVIVVSPSDPTLFTSTFLHVWDAARDQFVAFEPVDGIDLRTDDGGIARLYVYVDAFPEDDGESAGFGPIRVVVTMDEVDELFWLAPR
jgi:hypothetical protein